MNIEKDNIKIASAKRTDASLIVSWWNDGKVMVHAGFPRGLNKSI